MKKRCIPFCRLADNGSINFGEGNGDPHRPPAPVVHIDIRKVAELSPSEVVHIPATVPFEYQI